MLADWFVFAPEGGPAWIYAVGTIARQYRDARARCAHGRSVLGVWLTGDSAIARADRRAAGL
jgi:hypothetical protein